MTRFILSYSQCVDRRLIGGKAQRVAELYRKGVSVPSGFVIPTTVSEQALESSSLPKSDPHPRAKASRPYKLLPEQRRAFFNARIFEELQQELNVYMADLDVESFAVRSSAPVEDSRLHPFAGLFDSYLHIPPRELLGAIKKSMLSVFNDRAISYARQQRIKLSFEMAVLIMPMVYGEYSGVVFTVYPIHDQMMVIEIVKGLGDKLVLGQVSPSRYIMSRRSGAIEEQTGPQLGLNRDLLQSIYQMTMKLEKIFQTPQDIELIIQNDNVIIVQSRDIPPRKSTQTYR